jgi:Peptidase family M28
MQTMPETAAPQRPETATARQRRRVPLVALGVALLLVLLSVAAALPLWPPAARPASAPATEFSGVRATALLDGIASVPHPTGSPAQARVREYLVGELRGLGLDPRVQTRVAARPLDGDGVTAGTVANIYATIPGQRPTGRVLLVAHYDSVPTGPGAGDDGGNVAAILEVARALLAGPQPRNDIGVLFTDGEEHGMLGAKAFVDSGEAGDPARVVVLNLEARGTSGPAVMFQMAGTGLTSAVRASGAFTTSLADEVYGILPNDTDLTVFDEAGMRGLNFAFMGGAAHYHTPHDGIAQLSRRSVQDMGEATLAAARHLAAADLAARSPDGVYFSLFGTVVSYPGWLGLPLAGLAAAGFLALLLLGRRRGLSPRGAGRAAAGLPVCLVGAAAIGVAAWTVLGMARPDFALSFGNVYHPGLYTLGQAALLLVLLVAWYRWARRTASPVDVAAGVLGWFSLLGLAFAVLVPSAAYLFTWPALVGVAALAAALRFTGDRSPWRTVAGCAAAAPAVALLLPVVILLVPTLGISLTAAPLLVAALLGASVLGVLEPLPARRVLTAGALAVAVAGVATIGVGAAVDGYGRTDPRPVSLGYALEADTGTASWLSLGGAEQPVVGPLLTGGQVRLDDRIPSLGGVSLSSGPAPVAAALAGPRAEQSTAEERDGVRTVRLRITVPADAYSVDVYADTGRHEILDATVNGEALPGGLNRPGADGDWDWGFSYAAPPDSGVDLRIRARGDGPVRIRAVATSASLPAGAGAPTLSPDLSWSAFPTIAGETFVVRTFEL